MASEERARSGSGMAGVVYAMGVAVEALLRCGGDEFTRARQRDLWRIRQTRSRGRCGVRSRCDSRGAAQVWGRRVRTRQRGGGSGRSEEPGGFEEGVAVTACGAGTAEAE